MIRATIVIIGLALTTASYAADEKKGATFDAFRKKIELLTPKKKLQTTTAVGGVRGSKSDANELYWKGEMFGGAIDAEELAAFDEALTLAEAGNTAPAEKGLKAFMQKYPDSSLKADAEQALALLKTEAMPKTEAATKAEATPKVEAAPNVEAAPKADATKAEAAAPKP